jgi:hypothetical protein
MPIQSWYPEAENLERPELSPQLLLPVSKEEARKSYGSQWPCVWSPQRPCWHCISCHHGYHPFLSLMPLMAMCTEMLLSQPRARTQDMSSNLCPASQFTLPLGCF